MRSDSYLAQYDVRAKAAATNPAQHVYIGSGTQKVLLNPANNMKTDTLACIDAALATSVQVFFVWSAFVVCPTRPKSHLAQYDLMAKATAMEPAQ